MMKKPSRSVDEPISVPTNSILAPIIGLPYSSTTFPVKEFAKEKHINTIIIM